MTDTETARRQVHRICTLCEATCGITVDVEGGRVERVGADRLDPFSRGYLCPKAWGMKALQDDPDRLTRPLRREGSTWREIGWNEALAEAVERLGAVRSAHGADAIASYLGNPNAHSLHAMLYGPVLLKAIGSKQRYSASSLDQLPKMATSALMFGGGLTVPVPDLDRTRLLFVLGGNPAVSNGSLMTAPDVAARLRAIVDRGGRVVVFDPRRSETARLASEHHFVRPGTDAWLLLAMAQVLFAEGLVKLGAAEGRVAGLDALRGLVAPFTPARAEALTGVPAVDIARLAREFAATDGAACYGRIGTTCQRFGTVASWAVDVLNVLGGQLDRPGGAMFSRPAAQKGYNRVDKARRGARSFGRWRTRTRGLPELFGELPTAALADEIETPGPGQVRALVTIAGNPALSAPNAARLGQALASLEFMVSVDFYLNETTRHAHLILPPPAPLERDTYDLALYNFAIRNVAKYSPAALPLAEGRPDEWEILLSLAKGLAGMGSASLADADAWVLSQLAADEIGNDGGRFPGLDVAEALAALGPRPGPRRALDLLLRLGPFGDGFGRAPDGLSLARLEASPHGLDLGPLVPRLDEILATPSGLVELAPAPIVDDLARLEREEASLRDEGFLLIGRRHLRSNNSWMHNLPALVKGPERCTLLVHPGDASRLGLEAGGSARVRSRVGSLVARVELSDDLMPGVVSLPHGWGHEAPGMRQGVAAEHAGVNVNLLSDDELIDVPTGNAAFNGVPVSIERVLAAE
ncbi:MAG: molybdopterin oxidoreductase family protein [Polyangiaceae bacterium]|nr:molybdopterin oxidoreductase family protein [Polyangiaceae bacterium]